MPMLLCIRILDAILMCSATSIFCKHYYHTLIQHIVSLNFNNTSNLPLYFAGINIWHHCPLEILIIEANSINEFSLKLLNVWHIPTQIIGIHCLTMLIHRCYTKLEYLVPKIVVELYRLLLYYERKEAFDVASSSREQIDTFIVYVKQLLMYINERDGDTCTKLITELKDLKGTILDIK